MAVRRNVIKVRRGIWGCAVRRSTEKHSTARGVRQSGCCYLLFISDKLIRYGSSRGHKIDRSKQNKPGIRSEINMESRQNRTEKKVASKRHRDQQETKNTNKITRRRNTQKATT